MTARPKHPPFKFALPDANLRCGQELSALDWRKWTKEDALAASFFCPRRFDRAVMVDKYVLIFKSLC